MSYANIANIDNANKPPKPPAEAKPLRGPPVNPCPGAGSAFTTAPTPAGSVRSHHQFQLSKPDGGLGHLPVTGRVRGCSGSSGSRPSPDPRRLAPPESSSTENRPSACRIRCKEGIRPRHDRQAPPLGRQRAGRRQSRPLSRPLRAFQPRAGTPGYPGNPNRARQRHSQHRWHPRDSLRPTRTSNNSGAPSAIWHPPAHHGVAYTDPTTVDAASSARVVCQAPEQATLEDSGQQAVTALNPL